MVTISKKEAAIDLSMITGKVGADISYMVYLLLKDSPYSYKEIEYSEISKGDVVETLDDWFNNLGDSL